MERPLEPRAGAAGPHDGTLGRLPGVIAPDSERSRQVRFVAVGIWNTIFAYGEWALLQLVLGDRLHYLVILILAWPIAVLNAYICQRRLVFRSTGPIRTEILRFAMVYVATLAAGLVLLPILIQVLSFNIYVVQAGFTIAVVVVSYLAHRSFSFRPRSTGLATTSHWGRR
jgi:putative flippase GtrA